MSGDGPVNTGSTPLHDTHRSLDKPTVGPFEFCIKASSFLDVCAIEKEKASQKSLGPKLCPATTGILGCFSYPGSGYENMR